MPPLPQVAGVLGLAASFAADVYITVALCMVLHERKTGLARYVPEPRHPPMAADHCIDHRVQNREYDIEPDDFCGYPRHSHRVCPSYHKLQRSVRLRSYSLFQLASCISVRTLCGQDANSLLKMCMSISSGQESIAKQYLRYSLSFLETRVCVEVLLAALILDLMAIDSLRKLNTCIVRHTCCCRSEPSNPSLSGSTYVNMSGGFPTVSV